MLLFTKDIDKKLFAQYSLGANLENQMVVAKIFNPYGRGCWYLLNSDPEDSDYLWAIVDLFEVEMGSVSRSELESIKVPPFGLGLERDLYFTPINAKVLYDGLLSGKHYAKGGETDNGNLEMLRSNNKAIRHHTEELENELKGKPSIEAWVVAKGERAATDLSDITHYLDGREKMAHGGETAKTFIVEYELNGKKHESSYLLYPNDRVEKLLPPSAKIISIKEKMAHGGELDWGADLGDGIEIGTDVYITDSKSMFKGKTGFVSGLAGKDLLVTISENGNDRNVVVSKKGIEKLDAPEFAKGGEVEWKKAVTRKINSEAEAIKASQLLAANLGKAGRNFKVEKRGDGYVIVYEFSFEDKMAKGGEIMKHKHNENITIELIEPTSKGWKVKQIETHSIGGKKLSTPKEKIAYFSKDEIKDLFETKMAMGGMSNGGELGVKYYIGRPEVSRGGRFGKKVASWKTCVVDENGEKKYGMQSITMMGTPSKYKVDGIKITQKEFDKLDFSQKMAHGGKVYSTDMKPHFTGNDRYYVKSDKGSKEFISSKDFNEYIKKLEEEGYNKEMAHGGETTFADKVKAVKSTLLKNKKVSPKVQKDYGKKYSPKEALASARRIIGSQVAKSKK